MNQTVSNRRNAIRAAGIKALLAAAAFVAYFASHNVARAQAIDTEDHGISIDLDKPTNPGTNNPQPPPPPANDTPPPPANDAQPSSPPSGDAAQTANTPDTSDGADGASGGSGDVGTEPADGATDTADANPPHYDVIILIPELTKHSGPYVDEDAVYAAAENLSFDNIPHAIWDGSNANGGYYLYIKVPNWAVYASRDTKEEAEEYAQDLLAQHPSGRLQVKVVEHRD